MPPFSLVARVPADSHPPPCPSALPACSGFTPTCMAHPDTYLNKVVVGSEEGQLQVRTDGGGEHCLLSGSWRAATAGCRAGDCAARCVP